MQHRPSRGTCAGRHAHVHMFVETPCLLMHTGNAGGWSSRSAYVNASIHVRIHVCIHVCICTLLHVYIYTCIYNFFIYPCLHIHVHKDTHISMYRYVCIHIYTCIRMYAYTFVKAGTKESMACIVWSSSTTRARVRLAPTRKPKEAWKSSLGKPLSFSDSQDPPTTQTPGPLGGSKK